ncbi:MAG: twin-arginine translocase subunit TatC [Planctomycetaceae bacterium]|nr:MAG: twin-arginine translocase subunit TatC [Planctomycetaceae bacterium]
MVKQPDDDLFSGSTMTFGEHIEELRVCLGRALLGLLLGFMIGLVVASYVVAWIQTPLTSALENHYIGKAIDDLTKEYSTEGQPLSPQVVEFIREKRFVFERIYVEAAELRRVEDLLQGYEARTDEADEMADEATAPQTHPISAAVEADAESTPSAADTAQPARRDALSDRSQLVILGDKIPAPHPVLITARVWRPIDTLVKALSAQEAFMIWLKAAFVSGLVIASPYIFYQLWLFVAAGLYPHEKQYVYLYLPISILLFLAGAGLAFFVVFEYVLAFLFGFNKMMNIDPDPRISEWLGFVLFLPLGFGIAFQLPLVMLFLHRIGMFTIEAYLEKWRLAVLVIFAIAMLLTPADPVSMLLMAMPLTALYFLGIAMCHWMPRNRSPFAEGYDP